MYLQFKKFDDISHRMRELMENPKGVRNEELRVDFKIIKSNVSYTHICYSVFSDIAFNIFVGMALHMSMGIAI